MNDVNQEPRNPDTASPLTPQQIQQHIANLPRLSLEQVAALVRQLDSERAQLLAQHAELQADQQRAMASRLASRAKQAILDSLPAHIAVLDETGRIVDINASWIKFARENGHKDVPSVCVGADYIRVCLDAAEANAPLANEALAGIRAVLDRTRQHFTLEYPCHSPSQQRWFLMNVVPARKRKGGAVVTHLEITERKLAETALRQAHDELEQRVRERTAELTKANEELDIFRKFAEASGEGFGMSDLEGRIAYVNPALSRLFGEQRPQDVIGKQVSDYYPEDYVRKRDGQMIPALMHQGFWHTEQTVLPRQGKPRETLQSTVLIRDENGQPVRIAVVINDITERKRAQEALAAEYRNLKRLLQASDHERQLIAYEIHDGLAQQLAGALMQLERFSYARNASPQQAEEAFQSGFGLLRQSHFECRRLITGVRPPILDESGVVEAIAHLVDEQNRGADCKLEFQSNVHFDRLSPIVENAIYRIAQEGLANACQHSRSDRVRVRLFQRGDEVRIEIQDWGIGFDTAKIPKNRFGLEGIRQRARLLAGKFRLRSTLGKGTRIAVDLPLISRD